MRDANSSAQRPKLKIVWRNPSVQPREPFVRPLPNVRLLTSRTVGSGRLYQTEDGPFILWRKTA